MTDQTLQAAMNKKPVNPFKSYIDLAQPRLGTRVIYATDDFFADKSRLIDPTHPPASLTAASVVWEYVASWLSLTIKRLQKCKKIAILKIISLYKPTNAHH